MHSAEAVRHKIKLMIDNEAPKSILSDDRIVKILRDDGVEIARRTVAKYLGFIEDSVFRGAAAHETRIGMTSRRKSNKRLKLQSFSPSLRKAFSRIDSARGAD